MGSIQPRLTNRQITRHFFFQEEHTIYTSTMESVKNAANYVSETVKGTGAEASKETNKEVAKDSDANLSTRASAAKDAVVDKKDQESHNTQADVNKEAAKH